jgi:hypothetical protein
MRKATRIVASSFGFIAGVAGLEHGYFEALQGNTGPASLMFASMGPPCVPEKIWNACEPAMTILPNFLVTGLLTVFMGLLIMIWSAAFIQRRHGGGVLILLSVILLPVGGGFFPPLIGLIGGAAGTQINKPFGAQQSTRVLGFAATVWPWPLVIFMVWVLGQFLVGYFFNEFLKSIMGFGLLLILTMLPASVYTAYAYDAESQMAVPTALAMK